MSNKGGRLIKISAIAAVVCLLIFGAYFFHQVSVDQIKDGKYVITNCERYPDAYLIVSNNTLQLFNIDLNELYQERKLSDYNRLVENGYMQEMSAEQLSTVSDYNGLFVRQPWTMNYDSLMDQVGTFTKIWFFHTPDRYFGLILQYDSWNGEIQINDPEPEKQLIFKREKGL